MNLPEEFVLLAYADDGTLVTTGTQLDNGLGGSLLLELALSERVNIQDQRVLVRDPTPTGDTVVDYALAQLVADGKDRKPGYWVPKLAIGIRERVLAELVAQGVLGREKDKVMWVFPRTRYPSARGVEPVAEAEARGRLRAAVSASGEVERRTAALCALVAATGLERKIFADLDPKRVKARLKEISEGAWAAEAVRKTIDEVQAAIMVAIVVASTSSAVATSGF